MHLLRGHDQDLRPRVRVDAAIATRKALPLRRTWIRPTRSVRTRARSWQQSICERAQFEHAIAVLLGQVPSQFTLEPGALAGAPPPFDAGLPSTLLQRRPDVGRAERAMAAANAQIGVARAAWFPVFTLSGRGRFREHAHRRVGSERRAASGRWVRPRQVPLLDVGARAAVNTAGAGGV